MSFLRHREIFPSDEGATLSGYALAHRLDEFPAGYSSAGCSPAWPASASPTEYEYALQSSCRSRIFHPTANSVLTVCLSSGGHRNGIRPKRHPEPRYRARPRRCGSRIRDLGNDRSDCVVVVQFALTFTVPAVVVLVGDRFTILRTGGVVSPIVATPVLPCVLAIKHLLPGKRARKPHTSAVEINIY
jgi:hypothetical protein